MAALLVLFYEMLSEKTIADNSIKSINPKSEPLKSVIWYWTISFDRDNEISKPFFVTVWKT